MLAKIKALMTHIEVESCIKNTADARQKQQEARQRIDKMIATLNGEEEWFLQRRSATEGGLKND